MRLVPYAFLPSIRSFGNTVVVLGMKLSLSRAVFANSEIHYERGIRGREKGEKEEVYFFHLKCIVQAIDFCMCSCILAI